MKGCCERPKDRQVALVRGLAQLFLVEEMLSDVTFLMRYYVYKFIFNIDKIFSHKQQKIFIPNVR